MLISLLSFSAPLSAQSIPCFLVDGGELRTPEGSTIVRVCLDDMDEGLTEIVRTGFQGGNSQYFITTPAGFIIEILDGSPPFDLREYGAISFVITSIAYTGELSNFDLGDNICAIETDGCISFSNPLMVNRQEGEGCDLFCRVEAGSIALSEDGGTATERCISGGQSEEVAVTLSGEVAGDSTTYLITDDQGNILTIPEDNGPFDLSAAGSGTCLIWHLAFDEGLFGLAVGNNADDFDGCFSLSNPITVERTAVAGGTLSLPEGGDALDFCIDDGAPDVYTVFLTDNTGSNSAWIITDTSLNILSLPSGPPFDLSDADEGICLLWHLSFTGDILGTDIGANVADLSGCYDLSNPITATRNSGINCENLFIATPTGMSEAPCPVTSNGGGSFEIQLDGNTASVGGSFSLLSSDFDVNIGAHIHLGVAGQNGPVLFPLTPILDDNLRGGEFLPTDNTFVLTDEQLEALRDRELYVNIHTLDFPAGEIRGQFLPGGTPVVRRATLSGIEEVPSIMTLANGEVWLELKEDQLTVSGSFTNLQGDLATEILGGAHIHEAMAGRTGPVLFPLNLEVDEDQRTAVIKADSNVFLLTEAQIETFNNSGLYVNVHSEFVRTGELRGQITDLSTTNFQANLSGHQARPVAINTFGNGKIIISSNGQTRIQLSGSVDDLQDTIATAIAGGAHLHLGLAGSSGPIVFPLNITLDEDGLGGVWLPADNEFTVTPEQLDALLNRELYLNVHTGSVPSGEVRGQVLHPAKGYFGSNLAGINANPVANKTTGTGFMLYELCDASLVATGSFSSLASDFAEAIAGGSHIHNGDAASTGGIAFILNAQVADSLRSGTYLGKENTFQINEAERMTLLEGGYYFNLHTTNFPSGEIRGQLLRDDDAFPSGPVIATPEDGAIITVFDGGSDLENGSFVAATDLNNDLLVYTVEVTAPEDPDFVQAFACLKVGQDTVSNATIDAIYDTLIANGAMVGTSIPLSYRVIASDGSVATPGPAREITLVLSDPPCEVDGGVLVLATGGTTDTICAGDNIADPFNVILTDTIGEAFTYLVVNDQGIILDLPSGQPFDFDNAGAGACTLYAVSHDGTLTGAVPDASIDSLSGCFDLSNPIIITRLTGDDCTNGFLAINEVNYRGYVEIENNRSHTIDIGGFALVSNGTSRLIRNLAIECGELLLKPGDQVTVDASSLITLAHDELALLRHLEDPTSLLSYLAWGEGEQEGQSMAISMGLWSANTRLGIPSPTVSLQRIPAIEVVTYALGAPTPCAPNQLTTATQQAAVEQLRIIPNPFADFLSLEVTGGPISTTQVDILDLKGRLLFSRELRLSEGRNELNLGQLAAGAYLLRLTNQDGVSVARIIKR